MPRPNVLTASMRPRLIAVDDSTTPTHSEPPPCASMRPRLIAVDDRAG